jgi:hypothetical protein
MRDLILYIILALAAYFGTTALMQELGFAKSVHIIPICQEDQVLVGRGEFSHGRYDGYECGPALDDYVGG